MYNFIGLVPPIVGLSFLAIEPHIRMMAKQKPPVIISPFLCFLGFTAFLIMTWVSIRVSRSMFEVRTQCLYAASANFLVALAYLSYISNPTISAVLGGLAFVVMFIRWTIDIFD